MYEGPGLSVPPPVLYLVSLLVGIGLNSLWPLSPMSGWWGAIAGVAFIMASIMIVLPVLLRFRRAGTPFDVRKAASVLIVDGPYRFSRHPSCVSLTLLYVGIGLWLNNGWALFLVIPPSACDGPVDCAKRRTPSGSKVWSGIPSLQGECPPMVVMGTGS